MPVAGFQSLRRRVRRLFESAKTGKDPRQLALGLSAGHGSQLDLPTSSLRGFVDFLASAVPQGELYLFGGVLRDLALLGKRGFSSDVDLVIEGSWPVLERYLSDIGAKRNKFGGFRVCVGEWPVDIWNAEETWAIRQGLVKYDGIASLTHTTVLNWDAILMNWRSGSFVCAPGYIETLSSRCMDVVLESNPKPLGMAVRVFRHLSAKEARRVGEKAVTYMERAATQFSFSDLVSAEQKSYGSSMIDPAMYRLFALSHVMHESCARDRFLSAVSIMEERGDGASWRQMRFSMIGP